MMRHLFATARFLYLDLSLFGTFPFPVSIHPPDHSMFPLPNGHQINWGKSLWKILPEPCISIITVLSQVLLDSPLKELNKIELTVEFREENAQVTNSLNYFLNEWLLLLEVRLQRKDAGGTASHGIQITTWFLAFLFEPWSTKSSFREYLFHPFGLIWIIWVISGKDYFLHNFFTCSIDEPPIVKSCLSSTRIKIYFANQKCICRVSCMALRIIHHN